MGRAKAEKKPAAPDAAPAGDPGRAKLDAILANLNHNYKIEGRFGETANPIVWASKTPKVLRISTGLIGVDYVTGMGIPAGRITMLVGKENVSKSSLAIRIIAEAQRLCHRCLAYACDCPDRRPCRAAWIDVEKSWDREWCRSLGADPDQIVLVRTGYAEADLDIATQLLDSGEIEILVVDSFAQLRPKAEAEASLEEQQRALTARLLNKVFRQWGGILNRGGPVEATGATVIAINQFRKPAQAQQGKAPPQDILPGGEGQRFAASVILQMYKGSCAIDTGIKDKSPDGGDAEKPDGPSGDPGTGMIKWQDFKVVARKSKVVSGKGIGRYRLYQKNCEERGKIVPKGTFDEASTVFEFAVGYGVLEQQGSAWVWPKRDIKASSKPEMMKKLQGMPIPGTEQLKGRVTMWEQLRKDTVEVMIGEPCNIRLTHTTSPGSDGLAGAPGVAGPLTSTS